MGKPYARELEALPAIYDWARSVPIDQLAEFVKRSSKNPLYVIGSGGSFSAAVFASLLHRHIGMIAQSLTPLEFLESDIRNDCSILIITAGGNNTDILSSFDKAVRIKPKNLGILCASTSNKLTRMASKETNVIIHAVKLPTGKDGFLATNSLLATLVWLCRAYITSHSLPYAIPSMDRLVFDRKTQHGFEEMINSKLENLKSKETLVCIYDNWGKPAAIDIESKLIEAGLVNVQLSDYRNFAHGRHNWLDKNGEKTGLISLVNPQCEQLAMKTQRLIPEYVPVTSLIARHDGPIASLSLVIQVMHLVKFFGQIKRIDPGQPGVAIFGRKMYHLSIPKNSPDTLTKFEKLALRRKFGHASINKDTKARLQYLKRFTGGISRQKFEAVIFDYDGTICNTENRLGHPSKKIGSLITDLLQHDIVVGIATGRGKSVRTALQKTILKDYWSRLLIGYYNCSSIGDLKDSSKPNKNEEMDAYLNEFLTVLQDSKIVSKNCLKVRPKQISIQSNKHMTKDLLYGVQELAKNSKNVKIVESGHSIDILPLYVSKLNLIDHIQKIIAPQSQILCIGDSGDPPGNDSELLDQEFSLSVDTTSQNPSNCWNLLPKPMHGEDGVLEYFKHAKLNDKFFTLNISMVIK